MLRTLPWFMLALVALATTSTTVDAAEIRDRAGMFSTQTVSKAEAELSRIEKQTGVPILVETIESLPGLAADADTQAKLKAVNETAADRNRELNAEGIYMLLSKKDQVLSNVLIRQRYAEVLPRESRLKIRDAFLSSFKGGDYDGGLVAAVAAIDAALPDGPVTSKPPSVRRLIPAAPAPGVGNRAGAEGRGIEPRGAERPPQFGLGSLLVIGLGILAVLFVVRLLSGALGGGRSMGGYPPNQGAGPGMGGPGYGPGMGGAPGYGRGGGFLSGMLGGLGGALAGNWLYDQFSGRGSSQQDHASTYDPAAGQGDFGADPYAGGDSIVGGDDGGGGSWGDSGGDWGGGDWDDGGSW